MLNRLFIIVGLIFILALAAAFVVPAYYPWNDFRERLEEMASETLGAPVTIAGDVRIAILPQPRVNFSEVAVGPADAPVMTVAGVQAEISIFDLFRDRYALTNLVLDRPVVDFRVAADGTLETGLALADRVAEATVSVAEAQIVDGVARLADTRSGDRIEVSDLDGELRIETVQGPFSLQGTAQYGEASYGFRVGMGAMRADGGAVLSVYVRPPDNRFTFTADGELTGGSAPTFNGKMGYRQAPRAPGPDVPVDAGKGDLVVEGTLEASAEHVLLTDFIVTPDENRAASRLTGTAEVSLGLEARFNIDVSSTSVALPPRDATAEGPVSPYELVRLLGELPTPPVPPIPGTLALGISELNLRTVALRNLDLEAEASEGTWLVNTLTAQLPGSTALRLNGALSVFNGRPNFVGALDLRSARPDQLALLWRKPGAASPLFGLDAALTGRVALVGETLSLSDGWLDLAGGLHAVSGEVGFGSMGRRLAFSSILAPLDAAGSAALGALLPDIAESGAFALTFPAGRFDLLAPSVFVGGLEGKGLRAAGSWEGGVVVTEALSAESLGGAAFDARLTAFGTFQKPELSGTARLAIDSAEAPALEYLYDLVAAPPGVRAFLARSLPFDLDIRLDAPSGEGGQQMGVVGTAASAEVTFDARLGGGIFRALSAPVSFNLDLKSDDATAMTAQLGLGEQSLTPPDRPMHVVAIVEGAPANSLEVTLRVDGGADSLGFAGNVVVLDLDRLTGNGTLRLALGDVGALGDSLGLGGIDVPAISGTAHLEFIGTSSLLLEEIAATSGGEPVSGSLSLSEVAGTRTVSGQLTVGRFDPAGLMAVLVGRQFRVPVEGQVWPAGPLSAGDAPRDTVGRVTVSAPSIGTAERELMTDARFSLDWDATTVRLREFGGTIGGGQMTLDAAVCCAGPLQDKRINGRMTLEGVALDALLPAPTAAVLGGTIGGAAQFDGTGADLDTLLSAMTGQGSYRLEGLRIEGLDAGAFERAAALENVLDTEADVLTAALVETMDDADFLAMPLAGSFTIAGGTLRSPNLAIGGEGARLFGSTSLQLRDLGIGGGFVMSPTAEAEPGGLVNAATAQIAISLGGTLLAPEASFEVGGMIDAMKAEALEREVERLEQLRAEDEARQRAAAEERARIAAEEERRRAAEAAAQRAAEEAAAREREAAEAAERERAAAEEARRRAAQPVPPTDIGPLDLGIN